MTVTVIILTQISKLIQKNSNVCTKLQIKERFTSYLPPEQARDKGVSFVRSDCASISAPLFSKISTTSACPAVAAKISGVNPS